MQNLLKSRIDRGTRADPQRCSTWPTRMARKLLLMRLSRQRITSAGRILWLPWMLSWQQLNLWFQMMLQIHFLLKFRSMPRVLKVHQTSTPGPQVDLLFIWGITQIPLFMILRYYFWNRPVVGVPLIKFNRDASVPVTGQCQTATGLRHFQSHPVRLISCRHPYAQS